MVTLGLLARMTAKPGKEEEVAEFLKSALPMAMDEPGTVVWYAIRINQSEFGIFDAFAAESGREAHLSGPIAAALMQKAPDLFDGAPQIEKVDILAAK